MCLSDMESFSLRNSVMGGGVTLPPVVLGTNPRLRKQRKPSSHPLEQQRAGSLTIRAHSCPSNVLSTMIWTPEQGQQTCPGPNLDHRELLHSPQAKNGFCAYIWLGEKYSRVFHDI